MTKLMSAKLYRAPRPYFPARGQAPWWEVLDAPVKPIYSMGDYQRDLRQQSVS